MEEIKQAVLNYIKRKNTAYAIMINGSWGSGKTHFWNTELRPAIESVQGESGLLRTVYVSLYGISSTDEISQKIVYGIYAAKISAKTKKRLQGDILPEIGKVILNFGSAIGGKTENLLSEGAKALNSIDKLFNIKKDIVLCFDDLERASMDVHLIMGYINNLVEHDNIKSIIIGNEDEILKRTSNQNQELKSISSTLLLWSEDKIEKNQYQEQRNNNYNRNEEEKLSNQELLEDYNQKLYSHKNEYKMIKEKLIGKALTYRAYPERIIENILERFEQTDYGVFLNQNLPLIYEVFTDSKTNNYRILQHALDDFQVVFKEQTIMRQDVDLSIKRNILIKLLHFMLAYSFDFKSGNPDVKDFKDFKKSSDYSSKIVLFQMLKDKNNDEYKGLIRFKSRYFKVSYGEFYKSIELLVREGIFYKELLLSECEDEIAEIINRSRPDYYFLLSEDSYKQMSDEEFKRVADNTYKKFKNGEMAFYYYLYGFYMYRIFIKAGIFQSTEEVLYLDFISALNTIIDSSTFRDNDRLNSQLSFNYQDDSQLASIRAKIISINKELGQRKLKQTSDTIFLMLQAHDVKAFFEKVNVQFGSKPFFTLIQSNTLFNSILLFSNSELVLFVDGLKDRYDSNYKRNQLRSEKNFFDELRNLIADYFRDEEMTLRKHIFMDFTLLVDTLFEITENDE